MNILKTREGGNLIIKLEGRLDTVTSPQLEDEVKKLSSDVKFLTIDLEALEYVSSAGLRVILAFQKAMNKQEHGKMVIRSANENVMEVFEVTGFTDILTFE